MSGCRIFQLIISGRWSTYRLECVISCCLKADSLYKNGAAIGRWWSTLRVRINRFFDLMTDISHIFTQLLNSVRVYCSNVDFVFVIFCDAAWLDWILNSSSHSFTIATKRGAEKNVKKTFLTRVDGGARRERELLEVSDSKMQINSWQSKFFVNNPSVVLISLELCFSSLNVYCQMRNGLEKDGKKGWENMLFICRKKTGTMARSAKASGIFLRCCRLSPLLLLLKRGRKYHQQAIIFHSRAFSLPPWKIANFPLAFQTNWISREVKKV